MRTLQDLKGKQIQFLAPDTWKGCGLRIEKVVKVTGKRKITLTVKSPTRKKGRRIDFDRVKAVWWFKKLVPIDEWLNNGGE